jgi:polyhydroxyalkanoate synthesis regulator phasin
MESAKGSGKTLKDILDSLVAAGTITQAQADAITSSMPSKLTANDSNRTNKPENRLDKLVSAGTITQAQEDAINSALKSAFDALHSSK